LGGETQGKIEIEQVRGSDWGWPRLIVSLQVPDQPSQWVTGASTTASSKLCLWRFD